MGTDVDADFSEAMRMSAWSDGVNGLLCWIGRARPRACSS